MAGSVTMFSGLVVQTVLDESNEALEEVGKEVEATAKKLLSVGGGSEHEPSPPGAPPHTQSGALKDSVDSALTEDHTEVIGPTQKYGVVHEFGSRLHPQRPFMRPALRKVQGNLSQFFEDLF